MLRHPRAGACAGLALITSLASACDTCSIDAAIDARGAGSGSGWSFAIDEQYTHFATLQEDGDRIADPARQRMDSSITQLTAGYRFGALGLRLDVPYIHRSFRRAEGFAIDEGSVSGIGDALLLADATVYQWSGMRRSLRVEALAGLKAPTGDSDRLKEEENEVVVPGAPESGVHGHDLALGSGSWDGLVGFGAIATWHRAFVTADAQYTIRSQGAVHYRYADALTWSIAPGWFVLLDESRTLGLAARLSGERKGKDTFAGEPAEDTAMTALWLGPEASWTFGGTFAAHLAFELPLLQHNSSVQLVPDERLRAGVGVRF